MKNFFMAVILLFLPLFSFAGSWDQTPGWVLSDLKSDVQKTTLDNTIPWQWQWAKASLEWIKKWSTNYLQWLWYFWLSIALILIIYNWMIILTNFWEDNKLSKVKKRFLSLILWVVLLTSAVIIIKLVTSFIWGVF